jgi:hypothetical protein
MTKQHDAFVAAKPQLMQLYVQLQPVNAKMKQAIRDYELQLMIGLLSSASGYHCCSTPAPQHPSSEPMPQPSLEDLPGWDCVFFTSLVLGLHASQYACMMQASQYTCMCLLCRLGTHFKCRVGAAAVASRFSAHNPCKWAAVATLTPSHTFGSASSCLRSMMCCTRRHEGVRGLWIAMASPPNSLFLLCKSVGTSWDVNKMTLSHPTLTSLSSKHPSQQWLTKNKPYTPIHIGSYSISPTHLCPPNNE